MRRGPLTPKTIYELAAVLEKVDRCRRDGWTGADGELELGVRSIAVPVCGQDGKFIAGLSISVGAERMSMTEFTRTLLPVLMQARDTLQRSLFGACS
jgi:IclR family pca regulon transcriptional regulator